MKRALLSAFALCLTFMAKAQFVVPYSGVDSSSACSGTLYDHAGASGNYSNSANGYFYINPPGGSLDMTFTSFSLEGCCDYVRIYDGIGFSGTLLLSANGTTIPNGGLAINAPSGTATVRFTSDGSVTRAGFAMNWISSGGSATPSSSFTVSTTNPPLNVPIALTNNSSAGTYAWDFGDGSTSSDANPSHTYTTPGNYSISLTVSNCYGTSSTSTQSVVVQGSPAYTVTPDSIYTSVSCGGLVNGSISISVDSLGAMGYSLSSRELPAPSPYALNEDFESSLGAFQVSSGATANFAVNRVIGAPPSGSHFIQVSGATTSFNGLFSNFGTSTPKSFSYWMNTNGNMYYDGYMAISESASSPGTNMMFLSYIRYNYLRVYNGTSYYSHIIPTNTWVQVEVKNIDWANHTFDLYINGALVGASYSFYSSTVNSVSRFDIYTGSTNIISYDRIRIENEVEEPLQFGSTSGNINVGSTTGISYSLNTAGMSAGRRNYEILVRSNGAGADSLRVVPMVVDITGSSSISLDKSCINFGNVYVTQTFEDSIQVVNAGCDTLHVSSILSTHADVTTDVSSLNVPPFDTSYVYVTVAPNTIGAYADTIYFTSDAANMDVCVNGVGLGAPIISTDSTNYNVTSVGCNDSISFDLKIFNTGGTADLNWQMQSSSGLSDDFESGSASTTLWQSTGSNIVGSFCYSHSGSLAISFTGSNRYLTSVPFNSTGNDTLSFWGFPGSSVGTDCENPDGGEDVAVEYSTNGTTWSQMGMVYNYNTAAQRYAFYIPVTGNVQVRLRQLYYTSSTIDNYIFDDFAIGSQGQIVFAPDMGTTVIGDSVLVTGTLDVSELNSGTYQIPFTITSDDPNSPSIVRYLNVVIQGVPYAQMDNATCMDFGTVINGITLEDSVAIWNSGCDDLTLGSISSTNSDFSATLSGTTVLPGDTAYLHVTFNSNAIGAYQDTITVSTNDTALALCVTANGLGAPNFAVNPDSIYLSTSNCDDSLFVSMNISNLGGLSTLNFTLDSLRTNVLSDLNVTILRTGADVNREFLYTVQAINNQLPSAILLQSNATTAAQLTTDLENSDVFVIPELEYITTAQVLALAPAVQTYLNNGGQVIMLANTSYITNQLGMMSTIYNTTSVSNPLNIQVPSSEAFNNITSFNWYGLARAFDISNSGVEVLASGVNATDAVIATYPYGAGNMGYYGFDFYSYSTEMQVGLANMITMMAKKNTVDWAYLDNHADSAAVNDSVSVGLNVITNGLSNGRYTASIKIQTNDPASPMVIVPVVLDVAGAAEMQVDATCLDYDSLIVGLSAIDTTTIYNVGCDTLYVNGSSSSTGDYSIASALPLSIAPGDSALVEVMFSPSAMGNRDDSLTVYSSTDTLSICVNGIGLGAPVLDNAPDTLGLVLNKCDNFSLESFTFSNTGQGVLDYQIIFGEYYTDTTKQFFTTTGAGTVHNFNNTPVQGDSIVVTVVTSGDFDATYEYYTLSVEGSYQGSSNGRSHAYGALDTVRYVLTGANVNTWLADGMLTINIQNNSSVAYYSALQNFHHVKVEVYNSSLPAWLTFPSTTTGTLPVGGSTTKSMLFTATNLTPGVYTSSMSILSNDPVLPVKQIPIIFDVREEANIALSDTCVSFPVTQVGDTTTQQIYVVNDGCLPLNVTNVASLSGVFKVSPTSFTVPANDSVAITVSFIPTVVSNYSSIVTVTSNAGNETFCVNGSSDAKPTADFNFGIIDQCNGQVFFSDHSSGVITSYYWEFGDGNISTIQNPIHSYAKPGTYSVKLTVTNNSGYDTLRTNVSVNPLYVNYAVQVNGAILTNDTFYINYPIQFLDSSLTGSTWRWYLGDGTTSTLQNPTHTYSSVGNYQISLEVEDTAGCKKTYAKSFWILSDVGVDEETVSDLTVYPNPSSGIFNLSSSHVNWNDARVDVLDLRGALIMQQSTSESQRVDLTHLPVGVYMLRIVENDRVVAHRRVVKE